MALDTEAILSQDERSQFPRYIHGSTEAFMAIATRFRLNKRTLSGKEALEAWKESGLVQGNELVVRPKDFSNSLVPFRSH